MEPVKNDWSSNLTGYIFSVMKPVKIERIIIPVKNWKNSYNIGVV